MAAMQSQETPDDPFEPLRQQLRAEVGGRTVIILSVPYTGLEKDIDKLTALGASSVLLISPEVDKYEFVRLQDKDKIYILPGRVNDPIDWTRAQSNPRVEAMLNDLDPDLNAIILTGAAAHWTFDRDGKARVGKRVITNARPHHLEALEDKTNGALPKANLPTPAHVVVPARFQSLIGAHRSIGHTQPTVWSADNKSGIGSAGTGTFVVERDDLATVNAGNLGYYADRVRVSEYVEGLPFGVQGFVDAKGQVAILGITETLTALDANGLSFLPLGVSNGWQPERRVQQTILRQALAGAQKLHQHFGLVGGFSLDGILTNNGAVFTEVNARVTDGMHLSTGDEPALAWPLLQGMVLQGKRLDISMATLGVETQRLRNLEPEADIHQPGQIYNAAFDQIQLRPFTWDGTKLVDTPEGVMGDGAMLFIPWKLEGVPTVMTEVSMNPDRLGSIGSLAEMTGHFPNFMGRAVGNNLITLKMATDVSVGRDLGEPS